MGNVINISSEAMAIFEANQKSKKEVNNTFNSKNYLDTHLEEGEDSRTTVVRILPIDSASGFPFSEPVHFHKVRVPKEVSPSGWRSFLCLGRKNSAIDHEKYGTRCPFCEINKTAYDEMTKATDPLEKKSWKDTSVANRSKEGRICRVIERGKENEGVKFWRIMLRDDGSDPYNQIMKLYEARKAAAQAKGKEENIFDLFEGRDLIVTFHSGTAAATVVYDADITPLSEDNTLVEKWVSDDKKWTDVFTPKDYDYLSLIADFRVPYYVKGENGQDGKWVDKEAYTANKEAAVESSNDDIKRAEENLMYTESKPTSQVESTVPTTNATEIADMFVDGTNEGDSDDLPF